MATARTTELAGQADLLALHRRDPGRFPFLLHSGDPGLRRTAGHDILFGDPGETLDAVDPQDDFIRRLADRLDRAAPERPGLPFCGGWFVYLAYEMATALEPRLSLPPGSVRPLARATRCESAVINDRASNRCHVLGADDPALLSAVKASIAQAAPAAAPQFPAEISEDDPGRFLAQVARVIEYIRAGDVYQLNLSRRWQIREQQPADAAALFAALRQRNAAPFATLARWPDLEIISASPERLFRVRDGRIDTRPIAGTRPRHGAADADQKALAALIAHPKERAEHIMLIDLERNDLGRICRTGTVEVDELLGLESYATVHHIVSNVHGELRPDIGIDAILRAVFPGGTITGCPKIRCMEIITELEGRARGAYTGSVGYISDDGQMDFNILIRTLVREAGALRIDAGAGIVADSEPARELAETRAKAAGMLQIFSGTGP